LFVDTKCAITDGNIVFLFDFVHGRLNSQVDREGSD
jgi:hypothetical protein